MRIRNSALIGLLALLVTLAPPGCNESKPTPPTNDPGVARITLPGPGLAIRKPGEIAFRPFKASDALPAGTTIRSGEGIVAFNFLQNVQVTIGETGESEVILEGPQKEGPGTVLVLGLKKGDIWIASYADEPIVLKMPHAEVRGVQVHLHVTLKRDATGSYRAIVDMNSLNLTVRNTFGTLSPDAFCKIRVDESGPPTQMKQTRHGR